MSTTAYFVGFEFAQTIYIDQNISLLWFKTIQSQNFKILINNKSLSQGIGRIFFLVFWCVFVKVS